MMIIITIIIITVTINMIITMLIIIIIVGTPCQHHSLLPRTHPGPGDLHPTELLPCRTNNSDTNRNNDKHIYIYIYIFTHNSNYNNTSAASDSSANWVSASTPASQHGSDTQQNFDTRRHLGSSIWGLKIHRPFRLRSTEVHPEFV